MVPVQINLEAHSQPAARGKQATSMGDGAGFLAALDLGAPPKTRTAPADKAPTDTGPAEGNAARRAGDDKSDETAQRPDPTQMPPPAAAIAPAPPPDEKDTSRGAEGSAIVDGVTAMGGPRGGDPAGGKVPAQVFIGPASRGAGATSVAALTPGAAAKFDIAGLAALDSGELKVAAAPAGGMPLVSAKADAPDPSMIADAVSSGADQALASRAKMAPGLANGLTSSAEVAPKTPAYSEPQLGNTPQDVAAEGTAPSAAVSAGAVATNRFAATAAKDATVPLPGTTQMAGSGQPAGLDGTVLVHAGGRSPARDLSSAEAPLPPKSPADGIAARVMALSEAQGAAPPTGTEPVSDPGQAYARGAALGSAALSRMRGQGVAPDGTGSSGPATLAGQSATHADPSRAMAGPQIALEAEQNSPSVGSLETKHAQDLAIGSPPGAEPHGTDLKLKVDRLQGDGGQATGGWTSEANSLSSHTLHSVAHGGLDIQATASTARAAAVPAPGDAVTSPMQQIARHVAAAPGARTVEVALSPAELGPVRMTLSGGEGGLTVAIHAGRTETLDLLRANIHLLGQEFSSLGFAGTSFTFGQWSQAPQPEPQTAQAPGQAEAEPPASELAVARQVTRPLASGVGGLDIRL